MDLTFLNVVEKEGIDAPAERFADAFAHAGYQLWHANQMARYNILRGMKPPASGNWKNNPDADDIDFQIESDFIGLMSPGMAKIGRRVGGSCRAHHELGRWVVRGRLHLDDVLAGLHLE